MKKVLSLLFVALLALSAWADTTVTFIPGTTTGNNTAANAADEMTLDGVTISGNKAALAASAYRLPLAAMPLSRQQWVTSRKSSLPARVRIASLTVLTSFMVTATPASPVAG